MRNPFWEIHKTHSKIPVMELALGYVSDLGLKNLLKSAPSLVYSCAVFGKSFRAVFPIDDIQVAVFKFIVANIWVNKLKLAVK